MNISIITRHAPSNYGSLLQSIATLRILKSIGHNPVIIDYVRNDEQGLKGVQTQLNNKKEWKRNILKKALYLIIRYPMTKRAEAKFARMRKKYLKLTSRYSSNEELREASFIKDTDIFMTGSDQVWGPISTGKYDSSYFLDFVPKNAKRVAFASSFGKAQFSTETLNTYKSFLSQYNFISVREDSAVNIINSLNIDCAGQVLDPTLLIEGKEWAKFIRKELIKTPYILVYQIHNNPILDRYAIQFAEKAKLPLYRVSSSLHQINRGGKFIYLPEIGDFLSYFKYATYIITDSFHGTAFSINFNKDFIEILPNTQTGTRNQSILKLTGLENRIVSNYNDFSLIGKHIDYTPVNSILSNERKKSLDILKRITSSN